MSLYCFGWWKKKVAEKVQSTRSLLSRADPFPIHCVFSGKFFQDIRRLRQRGWGGKSADDGWRWWSVDKVRLSKSERRRVGPSLRRRGGGSLFSLCVWDSILSSCFIIIQLPQLDCSWRLYLRRNITEKAEVSANERRRQSFGIF